MKSGGRSVPPILRQMLESVGEDRAPQAPPGGAGLAHRRGRDACDRGPARFWLSAGLSDATRLRASRCSKRCWRWSSCRARWRRSASGRGR